MRVARTWLLAAATVAWACLKPLASPAAEPAPPPDTAAHTVIVPFDPARPIKDQKPQHFYLDYETFQRLWAQAKENRRPEKSPSDESAGAVVNMALHDLEVRETAMVIRSRLHLMSRGPWQSVKLDMVCGDAPADWVLDGTAAPLKDGQVLLEKSGAHLVEASATAGQTRGWREMAVQLPASAFSLVRLSVPLADGLPAFDPAGEVSVVSEEIRDGKRVFTLALATPGGKFTLKRTPASRNDAQPPAVVQSRVTLSVGPRVETVRAAFEFKFPGMERDRFSFWLDENVRPGSWFGTGLRDVSMRREGGRLLVDVRLQTPVRDAYQFELKGVRTFPDVVGSRSAPVAGAPAGRLERVILIEESPMLQISVTQDGAERLSPGPRDPHPLTGMWRLPGEAPLKYTTGIRNDSATAHVESLVQVGVNKLEILAAVTVKAGRWPLSEVHARLPAGFEMQSVEGDHVKGWQRDDTGVLILLGKEAGREVRLVLNAAKTRPPGENTSALPAAYIDGMSRQDALLFVAVNAAMQVRTTPDPAWRETDPSTLRSVFKLAPPWVVARAFLWEPDAVASRQPPQPPAATLLAQPARFSADAVLLVKSSDDVLSFSQQVGIQVEQGAVGGVKVRLPATLPEARVGGPDVREVQSTVQGGEREYTVTFQSDVLGTAGVTLDWELPPVAEAALPSVGIEGASRTRRFFIVDNGSSREMKTELTEVDRTVASAVPWLPDGLGVAELYQARTQSGTVKLAFSNTQATAGNAAVVTLAEITTALRANGDRWETVVYSLANRSLQFLPVRLPKGAELITVMVGSEMVRADWGAPVLPDGTAAEPCHLVPLIQMRAGELSQQVRLTYLIPAPRAGLEEASRMEDPRLVGLSAERTLWNVWVPQGHELRGIDGNMEEVVEEVMEDEKVQQKLSDVLRLNNLVSSASASREDMEEAYDNARKALEDVSRYQREKTPQRRRAAPKGAPEDAKKKEEVAVQSDQQLEKVLGQQRQILLGNGTKVEGLQKSGAGSLTLREQKPQLSRTPAGKDLNSWSFNKDNAAVEKKDKAVLEGSNVVLNDNVAVTNDFLKGAPAAPQGAPQPPPVQLSTGTLLPQVQQTAPQQQQQQPRITGNSTLNNARGSNFLAMEPSSDAPIVLNGGVTYSGGITVQGGQLTFPASPGNAPVAQLPPPPPALPGSRPLSGGGDPFAASTPVPAPAAEPSPAPQLDMSSPSAGSGGFQLPDIEVSLQKGYSYLNLGDFDMATQSFADALRRDPNNLAARRGLEKVEAQRETYLNTARDDIRAKMLNEVNRGWEDPVAAQPQAQAVSQQLKPQGRVSLPVDVPLTGSVRHFRKLKDHAVLELEVKQPLAPERKVAMGILAAGGLLLAGLALIRRKVTASS